MDICPDTLRTRLKCTQDEHKAIIDDFRHQRDLAYRRCEQDIAVLEHQIKQRRHQLEVELEQSNELQRAVLVGLERKIKRFMEKCKCSVPNKALTSYLTVNMDLSQLQLDQNVHELTVGSNKALTTTEEQAQTSPGERSPTESMGDYMISSACFGEEDPVYSSMIIGEDDLVQSSMVIEEEVPAYYDMHSTSVIGEEDSLASSTYMVPEYDNSYPVEIGAPLGQEYSVFYPVMNMMDHTSFIDGPDRNQLSLTTNQ